MGHSLRRCLEGSHTRRAHGHGSLCAQKVVTGPSLIGEKSTSPPKLGTNGWVVITVVIVLDTAFIKKLSRYLAPRSPLYRQRLARVHLPALNTGACAVLVAIVSFFRDDELDALDFSHLLALCFDIRLSELGACLGCPVCSAWFSIPGVLALACFAALTWVLGH